MLNHNRKLEVKKIKTLDSDLAFFIIKLFCFKNLIFFIFKHYPMKNLLSIENWVNSEVM